MNKTFLLLFFTFYYGAFAQDSLKTVVAEKGDGIYSILRKQGINPSKFYNAFIEANKEKLDKEEFLKTGQTYFIPDTTSKSKNTLTNLNNPKYSYRYMGSLDSGHHASVNPHETFHPGTIDWSVLTTVDSVTGE